MKLAKMPSYARAIQAVVIALSVALMVFGFSGLFTSRSSDDIWGVPTPYFVTFVVALVVAFSSWVKRQQANGNPAYTEDEALPPPP